MPQSTPKSVISVHHLLSQNVSITVIIGNYKFIFNGLPFLRIFLLSLLLAESLCQNTYDYTYDTTTGTGAAGTGATGSGSTYPDYPTYPDTIAPTQNPPAIITNPPPQTTLQPASPSLSGMIILGVLIKYT